jgi:hypothetical protein
LQEINGCDFSKKIGTLLFSIDFKAKISVIMDDLVTKGVS